MLFQSTPSSRKVTKNFFMIFDNMYISIHTFLAEGDVVQTTCDPNTYISIHTFLAEGDHPSLLFTRNRIYFNPHLPRGRWPDISQSDTKNTTISIHTFLAEGDTDTSKSTGTNKISIHTFLAEGDMMITQIHRKAQSISIHTFLAEGDLYQI